MILAKSFGGGGGVEGDVLDRLPKDMGEASGVMASTNMVFSSDAFLDGVTGPDTNTEVTAGAATTRALVSELKNQKQEQWSLVYPS